jgi:hypothetical protein
MMVGLEQLINYMRHAVHGNNDSNDTTLALGNGTLQSQVIIVQVHRFEVELIQTEPYC